MDDYPEGIIKNKADIEISPARRKAVAVLEAGIASVLPSSVMHSSVKFQHQKRLFSVNENNFDVSRGRIFVIGGGKASAAMARSLEDIVGADNICGGIVSDKYGSAHVETEKIEVREAGHPVPDEKGTEAVRAMLQLKPEYNISKGDLVICLISGGGSALMPFPVDGITLEDKQKTTRLLLECGADIAEINCIRKHLSKIKGGRLGEYFSPATVVSLMISDVIGNDLSVIASGPTYPDPSTFSQALDVLDKYNLWLKMPGTVVSYLKTGAAGLIEDTPKTLDNCRNFIIGDNLVALSAMKNKAEQFGLKSSIITAQQKGETGAAARQRADELKSGKYSGFDVLLLGGETTPRLPSEHGRGGRNQHYALVSLECLRGYKGPWLVASVGTDGSDYMAEIAGAIVDQTTPGQLIELGLSVQPYIDRYDSYGLLSQVPGSIIKTGNTGTNVGDVVVYILD